MRSKIWKLQKPILIEHLPVLEVMAYREGKEDMNIIPFTSELIEEVFGDKHKVYVKGDVVDGQLIVHEFVEEQSW